jgi:hypothetical protein
MARCGKITGGMLQNLKQFFDRLPRPAQITARERALRTVRGNPE